MQQDQYEALEDPRPQVEEGEERSNPYTLATVVVGLLMALSLLGSLLWRAFPPSIFMRDHGSTGSPLSTPGVMVRVPVEASAGWVDTGFDIEASASYLITASGQIQLGPDWLADQTTGPQGLSLRCLPETDRPCLLDGAPYGALVGKIDSGQPFLVGAGLLFTAEQKGRIWLSANDRHGEFEDNQGAFIVRFERSEMDGFERASLGRLKVHWR